MKRARKRREIIDFCVFVLPAVVLVVVSTLVPFGLNIYYSLTKWDGIKKPVFNGLKNYVDLFTKDTRLVTSLTYSVKYMIASVITLNVLGLLLALLLNTKIKTRNILRGIFFMPYGLSGLIAAMMFSFIFTLGFSNIYELTGIGIFNWSWLSDPNLAFLSIILVDIWKSIGYYMIIYIAGLQGVPADLMEAARVDGASPVQIFFKITLPLLMPTVTVCIFFAMSGALNAFDGAYGLTGGGPGYATTGMPQNIYREAFTNMRQGFASAKSVLYFVIIMIVSIVQLKVTQKREVEL